MLESCSSHKWLSVKVLPKIALSLILGLVSVNASAATGAVDRAQSEMTGRDIVEQCDNKYPGENQKSQLSITLTDKSGNERKTVYLRLWKDLKGIDEVYDKILFFGS